MEDEGEYMSTIDTARGSDFGTRYTQSFAAEDVVAKPFLQNEAKYNVLKTDADRATVTFARNEDACRVFVLPSVVEGLDGDMLVVAMADGHASVKLGNGDAVGGYEIASRSVDIVESYLRNLILDDTSVAMEDLPKLCEDMFRAAHDAAVCASLSAFLKKNNDADTDPADYKRDDFIHREWGALNVPRMIPLGKTIPSIASRRTAGDQDVVTTTRNRRVKAVAACFVPNDAADMDDKLADYGCTMTVVIVLPYNPQTQQRMVMTANVGDSEAHIYRGNKHADELTTRHTAENEDERARMRRYGAIVTPNSPYFHVTEINRSLMISRTIGHAVMQHFGFLYHPHCCIYPVEEGDTVVVATDGVWDFIKPEIIQPDNFLSVSEFSERIGDIIRQFTQRDNAAWCILKL